MTKGANVTNATVVYHREDGMWWADSPDLDGYTAVGDSIGELQLLVHEGLPFYVGSDVLINEELEGGLPLVQDLSRVAPRGDRWYTETSTPSGAVMTRAATSPSTRMPRLVVTAAK